MKFEAELAGGISLWDVTDVLPRHPLKKYQQRGVAGIDRLIHHHSGADGKRGLGGMLASARYVVEQRDWPGFAYTYWLPALPDRDALHRLMIYRGQPDDIRSNHTSKFNKRGVAVCWQGNLDAHEPTDEQYEMAEALVPWLITRHGLVMPDGMTYHREATGKKMCPGPYVERWVEDYRARV